MTLMCLGCLQGVSGVTHIDRFDTSEFTTKFAGEVKDLNIENFINKKNARRLDDVIKYILVSGKQVQSALLRHIGTYLWQISNVVRGTMHSSTASLV